ncbi:MAG TPA: ribbon-helix-helix protein, CopG family [Rickettsiales bacterium]|nr:ribbon-helix-helix protein, CopG family [Rickettsiales bacterium]
MKVEKIETISLKIPHNFVKQLDKIAKEEDRSRSSVMRMAFEKFLEDYAEEKWTKKIIAEYEKDGGSNQKTYTLEEIMNLLS